MSLSRFRIRVMMALVFVSAIYFALIAVTLEPPMTEFWIGAQRIPVSGFEPTPIVAAMSDRSR